MKTSIETSTFTIPVTNVRTSAQSVPDLITTTINTNGNGKTSILSSTFILDGTKTSKSSSSSSMTTPLSA
ncbi:hypothetical protein DPMN_192569 [Dreissena polymorpha]|uniref:Uncharacterized protein n=1 Tax=Dreissena polymorpha TaxID=45954 RepID=A0A9D4BFH7_DREPO|nr:hypothetical protein DPMN_192569 [Dreissena polymorpha]